MKVYNCGWGWRAMNFLAQRLSLKTMSALRLRCRLQITV